VSIANDGQEAVAKLALQPFDLVLMDVQMPAMDGLEATVDIRGRERGTGGHVPIVAMTAHAMKGDRERCLEAGMDGYIAKPIRPRELYETIAQVMESASLGDGARPGRSEQAPPSAADAAGDEAEPASAFDREAALERVDGQQKTLRELAHVFVEECPKQMREIEAALVRHDTAALRRAAHTIKGSADIFAAAPAVRAAQRLEYVAETDDSEEQSEAWLRLHDELERLLPQIRELEVQAV
jgi:CheY-like chemotaxis protein/HPt (histidine-containing phosphotransfer) domain-containing protein